MNIELIGEQLSELQQLTQGWRSADDVSEIEREIALDKIKRLYEELKFGAYRPNPQPPIEEVSLAEVIANAAKDAQEKDAQDIKDAQDANPIASTVASTVTLDVLTDADLPTISDATPNEVISNDIEIKPNDVSQRENESTKESFTIDIADISIIADANEPIDTEENTPQTPKPQETQETQETQLPQQNPTQQTPTQPTAIQPEIIAEIEIKPTPKEASDNALFDLNTIPIRSKKRRAIRSLYSDGVKHNIFSTTNNTNSSEPSPSTPKPDEVTTPQVQTINQTLAPITDPATNPISDPTKSEIEEIVTINDILGSHEIIEVEETNETKETKEIEMIGEIEVIGEIEEIGEIEVIGEIEEIEEIGEIEEVGTWKDEEEEYDDAPIIDAPTIDIPNADVPILGETLIDNVETTISELYTTTTPSIGSINTSVLLPSFNDRYLIAQELFDGDMAQCEDMLSEISDIENFDDAMIHIVENYEWAPESEATKLIIKNLEQKFQLN